LFYKREQPENGDFHLRQMVGVQVKGVKNDEALFEKIEQIRKCLETNDLPLYIIHVHALKSACAIVGADGLSETAAVLEEAGKNKNMVFIYTHTSAFLSDIEALLYKLDAVLPGGKEDNQNRQINTESLKHDLARLKTALDNFDSYEISNAVNSLEEYTKAVDIGDSIEAILQNRLIGEYEETVSLIDSLMQKLN
jgi:HPt (histidine-containing phosphotransfer) domain-containing protein